MDKKGIFQDGIILLVGFFILAISILIIYFVSDTMNTSFQNNDILPSDTKAQFDSFNTKFPTVFDWTFMTIFIGLLMAGIILSYVVPANPLIFVIMIIFTIVIGALGGFLSNAWEVSTESGALKNSADNMSMMDFVLNNFLTIIIVQFLLMTMVFYGKPEGGFGR